MNWVFSCNASWTKLKLGQDRCIYRKAFPRRGNPVHPGGGGGEFQDQVDECIQVKQHEEKRSLENGSSWTDLDKQLTGGGQFCLTAAILENSN
jgi:hypothetical protein